jgi:hypothetical protein
MTTRYLDFTGGNDSNDGSSFANRKLTLASAVSGLTGNDTVRIMASAAATSLGQSATWTNASQTVTLTTAVTANITDCDTIWTDGSGGNVTPSANTAAFREGAKSAKLIIAGAFTTGLAAFFATGTLNLSSYQQVSLWVRSTGTHASGVLQIKLCSDAAGVTAVNTVNIPALTANLWTPVTIDTAGALGASIASVALYCASDPGAVTVDLDNILACKASSSADSLTLTSLLSLNTDANEPWFTIKSINGTSIVLGCADAGTALPTSHTTLYEGSTATATTYKREPILLTAVQSCSANGTGIDTPINLEGGYDTTNMSTQSDITWLRAKDPNNNVINITGAAIRLNKVYVSTGAGTGVSFSGAVSGKLDEFGAAGCTRGAQFTSASNNWNINDARYLTGCVIGIDLNNASGYGLTLKCKKIWAAGTNAGPAPTGITSGSSSYGSVSAYIDQIKNANVGMSHNSAMSWDCYGTIFGSNTTDFSAVSGQRYRFFNCTANNPGTNVRSYFTKYAQTADDHRVFWEDAAKSLILSATDQRHTASDFAWKFQPKSSGTTAHAPNSVAPLALSVAKIACPASVARTVTLWVRRDSTSLTMRLRVPGGQIAGVASDVTASASGSANTWEQLTVSFTPSEAGVVEVFCDAYGGTTLNGWCDDIAVT